MSAAGVIVIWGMGGCSSGRFYLVVFFLLNLIIAEYQIVIDIGKSREQLSNLFERLPGRAVLRILFFLKTLPLLEKILNLAPLIMP